MLSLTRNEIIEVLREGGSVLWNGMCITHPSQIPSESELALNSKDDAVIKETEDLLLAEAKRIQAEIAALQKNKAKPAAETESVKSEAKPKVETAKPKAETAKVEI